jgi:hypothetical protein
VTWPPSGMNFTGGVGRIMTWTIAVGAEGSGFFEDRG